MLFTKKNLVLCAALFGLATSANAKVYKITDMSFNVTQTTIIDENWKTYTIAHREYLLSTDKIEVNGPLTLNMNLSNVEVGKEYTIPLLGYYISVTETDLPNIVSNAALAEAKLNFVNPAGAPDYTWTVTSPIAFDQDTFTHVVKVKASPIPEPSTATLGVLGLGLLMLRRRCK